MEWLAQLVAAEAVRSGADIWLDDAASAPFAADLARRNAHVSCPAWRSGEVSGGFRFATGRTRRGISADPTAVLAATAGPDTQALAGCRPDIWLKPGPIPPGFGRLHQELPGLGVRAGWRSALRTQLEMLARDLINGEIDPWDWMATRLAGQTCLREIGWRRPTQVALAIAPLSVVRAEDAAAAHALAQQGEARIQGALNLRIPTLRAVSATVRLNFSGAGIGLSVRTPEAGAPETSRTKAADTVVAIPIRDSVPWLDLGVNGHGEVLGRVELCLREHVLANAADAFSHDPLDNYGDPLAGYLPVVVA